MRSRHIHGLALVAFASMISACGGEPLADELALGASAEALVWAPQQVLRSSNWEQGDKFGYAIALSASADTAVIGAPFENFSESNSGTAYIFVRAGDTWTQEQRLVSPFGQEESFYAEAVAIDGDTVVVGAEGQDANATLAGRAHVFVRSGGTWTPQQSLFASDGQTGDGFGYAVAIKSDVAMISAIGGHAVYAFNRSGTTWTEQQKLVPSDGPNVDFGHSIAFDGDTLVVGAPQSLVNGNMSGAVYVFTRSGTTWTEQQKLVPSDGAEGDMFGSSVALSGDTILVGSPSADIPVMNAGAAYVFVRSGATWTEQHKFSSPATGGIGYGVALDGDRALIAGGTSMLGGVLFEFMRSATSWIEEPPIALPNVPPGAGLGGGFATRGDWVLAYGRRDSTQGANAEGVYAFALKGSAGEACAMDAECASGVCMAGVCVGSVEVGQGGSGDGSGSEGACSVRAAGAPAGPGLAWLVVIGLGLGGFRSYRRRNRR